MSDRLQKAARATQIAREIRDQYIAPISLHRIQWILLTIPLALIKRVILVAKQTRSAPKKLKPARRRYGPGRPTTQDLEQRKSRILKIATALFLEKGFAETSLVDVANQAGVATRTIYQHYGNKEDIFLRVVANNPILEPAPIPPTDDEGRSVFDILLDTAYYICDATLSDAALPFLRLMIAESQRFPDLMLSTFESQHGSFHHNVEQTFERLETDGKIQTGDHVQTAKYFIDLLLGNAPMQLNMKWIKSGPDEEEIRDKVALFMIGRFGIKPDAKASKRARKKAAR